MKASSRKTGVMETARTLGLKAVRRGVGLRSSQQMLSEGLLSGNTKSLRAFAESLLCVSKANKNHL